MDISHQEGNFMPLASAYKINRSLCDYFVQEQFCINVEIAAMAMGKITSKTVFKVLIL